LATDRRILVVGGTSSIGGAIVEREAGCGTRAVFNGRNLERGESLAAKSGAHFVPGDFLPAGEAERIAGEAVQHLGGLDGLVLAAGLVHTARISETGDAEWDAVLATNLVAPFRFAKACMPALADGGGAIVTIASGAALRTEMELGAYSVAKRSVAWMTNMLAVEGGPHGVSANVVCPGDIEPGMDSIAPFDQARTLGPPLIPPMGRLATPEDVARAACFFLDDIGGACTGASLLIDGGMRAALRAAKVHQP
jgi:3-hydroxybutyrate dehydrogenase